MSPDPDPERWRVVKGPDSPETEGHPYGGFAWEWNGTPLDSGERYVIETNWDSFIPWIEDQPRGSDS